MHAPLDQTVQHFLLACAMAAIVTAIVAPITNFADATQSGLLFSMGLALLRLERDGAR